MTVRYSYVIPDILEVIPTLTVKLTTGASTSYVQSLIDLAFLNVFELGTTTKLGVSKYHSDIIGELEDVEGVDRVYLTLKIEKELSAEYDSLYDFAETVDVLPVTVGSFEIYIDDTLVAVDDGLGGWVSEESSPTVTGVVDYVTGLVEVNINPVPGVGEKVYVRYTTDQNGDIEIGKNQILKYTSNNVDYVSIS